MPFVRLPRRWECVTAHGERCSIDASSKMRDRNGQLVAEPLARGCAKCRLHLELLATAPVELSTREVLLVHVDVETTGLNPLEDEIVEFGAVAHRCGARFAITSKPAQMPDSNETTVHGIGFDELAPSPTFKDAFLRFAIFLDNLAGNAVETSESDNSQPQFEEQILRLRSPTRRILLAAHNGRKFDFPFIASEALRCGIPLWRFETWAYVDTMVLGAAAASTVGTGCAKLQCLGQVSKTSDNRAHRALDDTLLLRNVVSTFAARLGTSAESLLAPHSFNIDSEQTLLNLSFAS